MIEKIAIVGLGSIGRRHLRLARELRPELNIAVVRSGRGENTDDEKLADTIFYSMEDAIYSGIQAAVIATPSVYHLYQAKELMLAGVHVLVEKPLSNSMEDVDELLAVERGSGVVGLVGYCFRYNYAALKFRKMLSNKKKTGQKLRVNIDCCSYLPDWRPGQNYQQSVSAKKELGGGVLLELSHELDYIRWFFGNIKSVSAVLQNSSTLDIDVEDSADLVFKTASGLPIYVHLDFNSRNIIRTCSARCSNGDLIWDVVLNKVIWRSANGSEEVESFDQHKDEILMEQLKHFLQCIEYDQSPMVSIEDGIAVLQMVDAARESNSTGKRVALA